MSEGDKKNNLKAVPSRQSKKQKQNPQKPPEQNQARGIPPGAFSADVGLLAESPDVISILKRMCDSMERLADAYTRLRAEMLDIDEKTEGLTEKVQALQPSADIVSPGSKTASSSSGSIPSRMSSRNGAEIRSPSIPLTLAKTKPLGYYPACQRSSGKADSR